MNLREDIEGFFKSREDLDLDFLFYIMVSEWHWTQRDIEDTDIPFMLVCFNKRAEALKKEQDAYKKSKRK